MLLVQQLEKVLDDEDDSDAARALRQALVAKKLKKIIEMTYRVIDYHDRAQKLMQLSFFVDFTMFSFILCMILFTIRTGITPVLLLLSTLVQIFAYCWMGNRVIIRFEALAASLYGLKWYLMDIEHQKYLQLILLRAQNMKEFNGIFKKISLETFKEV